MHGFLLIASPIPSFHSRSGSRSTSSCWTAHRRRSCGVPDLRLPCIMPELRPGHGQLSFLRLWCGRRSAFPCCWLRRLACGVFRTLNASGQLIRGLLIACAPLLRKSTSKSCQCRVLADYHCLSATTGFKLRFSQHMLLNNHRQPQGAARRPACMRAPPCKFSIS